MTTLHRTRLQRQAFCAYLVVVLSSVLLPIALFNLLLSKAIAQSVGLEAAYSFNEGTGLTAADSSGNGLTGALTNGAAWTPGKYGNAVFLDGMNDYVTLADPAALQMTGSLTVSAWIHFTSLPLNDAAIVSKRGANRQGYQLAITVDRGPRIIGFELTNGAGANMSRYGATVIQTDTWYHVAGVYDAASQTMNVYLNGQLDNGALVGTVTDTQQSSTQSVNIGQRPGLASALSFAGILDDVRIYSRALSQAEIEADMNTPVGSAPPDAEPPTAPGALTATPVSGTQIDLSWTAASDNVAVTGYLIERCTGSGCSDFTQIAAPSGTGTAYSDTGLTPGIPYSYRLRATDAAGNLGLYSNTATAATVAGSGLMAAYSFDDGTGTTAADSSGNGLTGALTNGPAWTLGKYGNAVLLDGTNDYVDLGNPPELQMTGSMTVSAWIHSSSFLFTDAAIVSKRGTNRQGYQLDITVDRGPRTIGFKMTSGGGAGMSRYGATPIQTNTWYHVAGVYDADALTMNVYLNGQSDNGALAGAVTGSQQNSPQNVNIGQRPGMASALSFAGSIDDLRIYSRALSQTEIQSDMNTPIGSAGPDMQPPTAPGALAAADVSGSRIDLSWTAASDNVAVTGHLIERCAGTGCSNFTQIAAPAGTGTAFSDNDVTTGITYSYRVRATDAAGNLGPYSNTATATVTTPDTTPPTSPASLTVTAVSATRIDLSWIAASDNVAVTGYRIERCPGSGCSNFIQIASPAGTGTSYSDASVVAGNTYNYRTRATDAAGNLGPYSNTASATTLPPDPVSFDRIVVDNNFSGDVKAVGDVDGDGFADLIIGGAEMNWYRYPSWNKSTIATPLVEFTTDMQAGDVDNDGDLDIITADSGNGVIWLENPRPFGNPSSAWSRHAIGPQSWAHDIEVGDIDRDGKLDVVSRRTETYLWFQDTPASWSLRDISSVVGGVEGMGIGDIDGDGDLDLAADGAWIEAPSNPRTGIWINHQFASGLASDTTAAVGDFNGDSRMDIVFGPMHSRGKLAWYEAPANPKTGFWLEHIIDNDMGGHKFNAGDLNNDGLLDLVVGLELAELSVYVNQGGAVPIFAKTVLSTTGLHNQRLADIGNDGDLDIFGANWIGHPPVELWQNNLPSTHLPIDRWTYKLVSGNHAQTFGLAFGDIDSDSRLDIVSGPYWYSNPGGNMLGDWSQGSLPTGMHASLVMDVDGDFLTDIIAQKNEGDLALYWLEPADATAGAWNSVRIGSVPAASHDLGAQGYRSAQIEAGGKEQVVIASGNGIYYFRVPAAPEAGNWPRVQVSSRPSDEGFAAGDIDRDGDLDIAATTGDAKGVEWYANPRNGSSGWATFAIGSFPEASFPDRTEIADLNQDGRLDIIVTEENGGASDAQTYWWRQPVNPANPNWPRFLIASQGTTNSMDVADMDHDGDTDVVLAEHRGPLAVTIWSNDGNGNLTGTTVSTGHESHLGARTVDLDDDGDLDIVSIAWDAWQNLHLWRNDALVDSNPPTDTTPPSVSMTSPTPDATVSGTISVAADATDDVAVAGVQFMLDGANLGAEDTTVPYSISWNTATVTNGLHTLSAVARDGRGNRTTATAVSVTTDNIPLPVPTEGLVGYWAFDEGEGITAADSSGNGNNGTLVNEPVWTQGRIGSALSFDGVDDAVSLGNMDVTGSGITISAWIIADDFDESDARIVSKSLGSAEEDHDFMISTVASSGMKLRFRIKAGGSTSTLIAPSSNLVAGQWIHVAAVYDGADMIIYQDGTEVGRSGKTGALSSNGSVPAAIARNPQPYGPFDGSIDEVRIYNRALSSSEIQEVYLYNGAPPSFGGK